MWLDRPSVAQDDPAVSMKGQNMQTIEDYSTWADDVHTAEQPYCNDLACWCHTDTDYHDEIHEPEYDEETLETAYRFYGVTR